MQYWHCEMNQIGIFVWVSVKACSVGHYINSMWHRLSLALTKNWRFKTWGFAHKRFELSTWQGFAKSRIGNLCWELHQLQRLIHYFQHVGTCWTLDTFHTFHSLMERQKKNYFLFLELWKYLFCLVGLGDLFAEHKQEQQKAKFPDKRQTSSKYFSTASD